MFDDLIGFIIVAGFVLIIYAKMANKTIKEVLSDLKELLFGGNEDEQQ